MEDNMKDTITLEDINNFLKLQGMEWDNFKWRKYYRKNYIQDESESTAENFYGYIPLTDGSERLLDISPIGFIVFEEIKTTEKTFREETEYSKDWIDYQLTLNSEKIKDTIVKYYLEKKGKLKAALYYSIAQAKKDYDTQIDLLENNVSSVFDSKKTSSNNCTHQGLNAKVDEILDKFNPVNHDLEK